MQVKYLQQILSRLDPEAIIDIASDEEGNSFGDIDPVIAEGKLKDGTKAYSLFPENQELPEDRYK